MAVVLACLWLVKDVVVVLGGGRLLMGHCNISGHYATLSPLLRSEGGGLGRLARSLSLRERKKLNKSQQVL